MIYIDEKWLITGGTGSFAERAIPYILDNYKPREIVVFSRDEYKQHEMKKTADERVSFAVGDIRDRARIDRAMKNVRYVIHAAALKHVATGEADPLEVIKTNVAGTQNVVDACNRVGARMVLLSTDKACEPINTYGATKMLSERITLAGNQAVVRYGNVIGSRGSVVGVFREMAKTGHFTLTDERCTRFLVTFDYAIKLAIQALDAEYPEAMMLVSKVDSFYIEELCYAMVNREQTCSITERGLSVGEKLHETLLTAEEAGRAVDMGWYYHLYEPDEHDLGQPYTSGPDTTIGETQLREVLETL